MTIRCLFVMVQQCQLTLCLHPHLKALSKPTKLAAVAVVLIDDAVLFAAAAVGQALPLEGDGLNHGDPARARTHTHTGRHAHTYTHTRTHARTHTHTQAGTHTRIHTQEPMHTNTYTGRQAHTYTHTRTHAHTYTHMYTGLCRGMWEEMNNSIIMFSYFH
jgi:hypothetical protein